MNTTLTLARKPVRTFVARLSGAMIASLCLAGSIFAAPAARAQDTLRVNGWKPELGQRTSWRLEHEYRSKRTGMPGWLRSKDSRKNHETFLSQTPDGYTALWELETPGGNSEAEQIYARALSISGINRLVIGTNAAAMPLHTHGVNAIRDRLAALIQQTAQSDPPAARWLQDLLTRSQSNPLFEISSFANAALLIGRLQRTEAWDARTGMTFTLPQKDLLMGDPVQGQAQMRVENIDRAAGKITISWVWDFPKEAHPAWLQEQITEELAKGAKMAFALPGPDRAEATSFLSRFSGRAEIATDNGAVLKAEETRELRISTESNSSILRITRE